mgnify:CR=1 FL=1
MRSKSLLAHFMFIGLGFMFIEVSQMQTLNLLLGNPVLSLSVVLFTLLLSGGLGSLHTSKILAGSPEGNARYRLGWLLLLISATGLITPVIQSVFHGTHIIVRILMALIMVAPMGFAMGMAFPMGIQLAVRKGAFEALPWLWGLNGAASVFASVLSILISLTWGISVTFWCGFSCYLLATVAYLWADNASMNWTSLSPGPSSSPKQA